MGLAWGSRGARVGLAWGSRGALVGLGRASPWAPVGRAWGSHGALARGPEQGSRGGPSPVPSSPSPNLMGLAHSPVHSDPPRLLLFVPP